jgi:hypothetical protein
MKTETKAMLKFIEAVPEHCLKCGCPNLLYDEQAEGFKCFCCGKVYYVTIKWR